MLHLAGRTSHLTTGLFDPAGRRGLFYYNRIILAVLAFPVLSLGFFGILFDFNPHFPAFDLSPLIILVLVLRDSLHILKVPELYQILAVQNL